MVQRPGRPTRYPAAPGTGARHRSDAALLDRRQRRRAIRHVQCERRRNRDALSGQHVASQQFQWKTKFDNGGPLRGNFDASFAQATSNLQAAQADVEHGLYTTSAGVATSPGAPGCNNGASTAHAPGNHGYEFNYANGGTSGLPSVSYYRSNASLEQSGLHHVQVQLGVGQLTDERELAVKAELQWDPAFINDVQAYNGRHSICRPRSRPNLRPIFDQRHGLAWATRTPATQRAGLLIGAGFGPWLYYQDPGYGSRIFRTPRPSPIRAWLTVPNFGAGTSSSRTRIPAASTIPRTYYNQVWAGAGSPNKTEQFFVDGLSSFEVTEHTTAPYLMVDLGSPSSRFHVNFGVRLVDTDLTINGGETNPQGRPTTAPRPGTAWIPM